MSFANPTALSTLDNLNWGTATGAETTNTLGMDPANTRVPPDKYHGDACQIANMKNLLISMTQFMAGGNRLKVIPNAANQFGAGESGVYIDSSGNLQIVSSGVPAGKLYVGRGLEQTIPAASSVTVVPSSGETVRVTLSATAISTMAVSAGLTGQRLVVYVIQDSTGGRTIPTTWTNVLFPGGTYTATATANKRDKIILDWDNTSTKWGATVALNL
jgi:hypothetical protein